MSCRDKKQTNKRTNKRSIKFKKTVIKQTQMQVAYFIRGIIYCAVCLLEHIQIAVAEK